MAAVLSLHPPQHPPLILPRGLHEDQVQKKALHSNYTSSWRSSFLSLEYSAEKFKVIHVYKQDCPAPLFLPVPLNSLFQLLPFLPALCPGFGLWSHRPIPWFLPRNRADRICRVERVMFLYEPGLDYAKLLPCWACHGTVAKTLDKKTNSKYVKAEARFPSGRSPTQKCPTTTDRYLTFIILKFKYTSRPTLFLPLLHARKGICLHVKGSFCSYFS